MSTTTVNDSNAASSVYAAINAKSGKTTGTNSMSETEDRFLKLLVTQLRNQDPLNPLDNAQMTSQMAQISTVNGIEKLNTTLQSLISNSNDAQKMQAATMVGKGVLVPGAGLDQKAANGAAYAGFDLAAPADSSTITINDVNGITVRTIKLGGMAAGTHTFQWDGKTDSGAAVADGSYSFKVAAQRGGTSVESTALQLGLVTGIMNSSQGVSLNVGNLGTFKMSDVKEIL
ncbi:MAG: flagellar hook assembly protein FlgD [Betaproteobacteria bacterium]|nr:flagellar hook assembly protein FlgD [Betaproteobacteria bacterium]